ncbi:DUF3363 domain-containing protein [Parathalassolituus penaei]|uniref:DUF3363 domain-containing protein n=1 Tax=Parathalassolituus penaei TaxID=2997323 RepID=UPI003D16CD34
MCVGIMEREAEGVWRVPGDVAERSRKYDAQRLGGGAEITLTNWAADPPHRRYMDG